MQTTPALQVASTNQPPSLDNNNSLRDGNREKELRGGIVGSDSESLFPLMVLLIFQEAELSLSLLSSSAYYHILQCRRSRK